MPRGVCSAAMAVVAVGGWHGQAQRRHEFGIVLDGVRHAGARLRRAWARHPQPIRQISGHGALGRVCSTAMAIVAVASIAAASDPGVDDRHPVYVGAKVCSQCHAGKAAGHQFSL
ncbi:MAG: hypothetical protein WBE26_16440, partial [Phycisphaerae bacterium]